jgi:hypothetical protein
MKTLACRGSPRPLLFVERIAGAFPVALGGWCVEHLCLANACHNNGFTKCSIEGEHKNKLRILSPGATSFRAEEPVITALTGKIKKIGEYIDMYKFKKIYLDQ